MTNIFIRMLEDFSFRIKLPIWLYSTLTPGYHRQHDYILWKSKGYSKGKDIQILSLASIRSINEKFLSYPNEHIPPNRNLKFSHKFPPPLSGAPDPPKHYRVRVSYALTPTLFYVNILDEEFGRYQNFNLQLQKELRHVEKDPVSRIKSVHKGIATFFS